MNEQNQGKSRVPAVSDANTGHQLESGMNIKSVREMSGSGPFRKSIGKADSRYWQQPGKLFIDARFGGSLSCKIQVNGRRVSFPLRTTNKTAAAAKAAKIYGDVASFGWDAALAKHKPEMVKALKTATIGEWLHAVKATMEMRPITFASYAGSLRKIAADIQAIGDQPAIDENGNPKRDKRGRITYMSRRHGEGNQAWIAKVHALPLSSLSAASVQRWKLEYLAKAGESPEARKRAENSAAKLIRCARSLFSSKARKFAAAELLLPDPIPFAGIELPKKGNSTYASRIDAAKLIETARQELNGEPFKIFILGLLVGLRKKEIDLLTWAQVDFEKAVIRIERTEFFSPKSEDSIGEVDLDPELVAMLRGWKASASGSFVVESKRLPRHESSIVYYRCEPHFKTLYAWLRVQGITARKPLHELRKELGAILASTAGIFAAQSVLRHAQISTTAAYYTDKKRRISAGLGSLLTALAPSNVVEGSFVHEKVPQKPRKRASRVVG
jgi:integrase